MEEQKEIGGHVYASSRLSTSVALELIDFPKSVLVGLLEGLQGGAAAGLLGLDLADLKTTAERLKEGGGDGGEGDAKIAGLVPALMSALASGLRNVKFSEFAAYSKRLLAQTHLVKGDKRIAVGNIFETHFVTDAALDDLYNLVLWVMEVNRFGPFLRTLIGGTVKAMGAKV